LKVLVVAHGAADELHFPSRLAFEVENLLDAILHVHERIARVVLRDRLAFLRRHPEAEDARPGIRRREAHAHRRGLAVGGQRHLLRADDPAVAFHVEGNGRALVARLREHDVNDERGAFQHAPRRGDAADLDVAWHALASDTDGEYRYSVGFQREQRIGHGRRRRVGAVGDHDHAGERKTGKIFANTAERFADPRLCSAVRQLRGGGDAVRTRRKLEGANDEALRDRFEERAIGRAELVGHELAARFPLAIGDPHAARVVYQDGDEILLRDGGAQDQDRPKQAEDRDPDRDQAEGDEHDAIAWGAVAFDAAIRHERRRGAGRHGDHEQRRRGGDREAKLSLFEDRGPVLEEERKKRFHGPPRIRGFERRLYLWTIAPNAWPPPKGTATFTPA
jgi:hypothetical protein